MFCHLVCLFGISSHIGHAQLCYCANPGLCIVPCFSSKEDKDEYASSDCCTVLHLTLTKTKLINYLFGLNLISMTTLS